MLCNSIRKTIEMLSFTDIACASVWLLFQDMSMRRVYIGTWNEDRPTHYLWFLSYPGRRQCRYRVQQFGYFPFNMGRTPCFQIVMWHFESRYHVRHLRRTALFQIVMWHFEVWILSLYDLFGYGKYIKYEPCSLKRGWIHVRNVSSQISLCSPHRLISTDSFRLKWWSMKCSISNKNTMKAESVVPDLPVWSAHANLGQHFTHTH